MIKATAKRGPKYGNILGIKVSSTSRARVLEFVRERLKTKEKFYIVTPNPEIVLMATRDWLLKKAIFKADLSVPDGIGLKFAYKFLHDKNISIIKGRELFLDIIKIADENKLNVYLFGGENGEQEKAIEILKLRFPAITFKTHYKFPNYTLKGQPATVEDRILHKKIIGSIKLFEPDLVFVAMTPPKQEKWIFRNLFRLRVTGAMAIGGTFNYIAGNSKLPPLWMAKYGLEWVWRLINEPYRYKRIFNAVVVFPWKVLMWKLNPPSRLMKKV